MIPFRTSAPADSSPAVTMSLIVVNIAVFTLQLGMSHEESLRFLYTYALVPRFYSEPQLTYLFGLEPGNYLPFISNTFMHGGFLHIILNMWTLWLFGAPLEDRLGRWRFLLLYLASGLVGSIGHLTFNWDSPVPALGASGAIAGVLGAFTLTFPKARVLIVQPIFFFPLVLPLPALWYTGIWFAIQVWQGTSELGTQASQGGGIAWWAHIGGFGAGLLAAWLLAPRTPPPPPREPGPWELRLRE